MILFFFAFAFSENVSENYMVVQGIPQPSASAEENRKAALIVSNAQQKIDQCYDDLGRVLNNLCVNLDVDKRIKLAISIMICEQKRDGRADNLPPYDSDLSFLAALDTESFNIFTIYFINIDTICFHSVRENISSENMKKILSVFQAVSLSTEFLSNVKKNLDELMMNVKTQFQKYQDLFENENKKFQEIHNSVVTMIKTIKLINEKATNYKFFVNNLKFDITILGIAFILSFSLPNVFFPILFLVGFSLFIEISAKEEHFKYITHYSFKLIFVFLSLIIVAISVTKKIHSIKKKKEKKMEKKKKSNFKLVLSKTSFYEKK